MTFSLFKIATNPPRSSYFDENETHPRWTPQYESQADQLRAVYNAIVSTFPRDRLVDLYIQSYQDTLRRPRNIEEIAESEIDAFLRGNLVLSRKAEGERNTFTGAMVRSKVHPELNITDEDIALNTVNPIRVLQIKTQELYSIYHDLMNVAFGRPLRDSDEKMPAIDLSMAKFFADPATAVASMLNKVQNLRKSAEQISVDPFLMSRTGILSKEFSDYHHIEDVFYSNAITSLDKSKLKLERILDSGRDIKSDLTSPPDWDLEHDAPHNDIPWVKSFVEVLPKIEQCILYSQKMQKKYPDLKQRVSDLRLTDAKDFCKGYEHGPLAAKRGDPLPTPENFGHIIVAPTKDGKINFEYFVRNCPHNILEQMFADIPGFLTDPYPIDFIQSTLDGNSELKPVIEKRIERAYSKPFLFSEKSRLAIEHGLHPYSYDIGGKHKIKDLHAKVKSISNQVGKQFDPRKGDIAAAFFGGAMDSAEHDLREVLRTSQYKTRVEERPADIAKRIGASLADLVKLNPQLTNAATVPPASTIKLPPMLEAKHLDESALPDAEALSSSINAISSHFERSAGAGGGSDVALEWLARCKGSASRVDKVKNLANLTRICHQMHFTLPTAPNALHSQAVNGNTNAMNFVRNYILLRRLSPEKITEIQDQARESLNLNIDIARNLEAIEKSGVIGDSQSKFLRVVEIVLNASSVIKGIQTYNEHAAPKVPELFDLDHEILAGHLRFRVLRDKDPYHFTVGSDTSCCQVIEGAGEDAAVQSYVNPLAGVLVLECNKGGAWETVAQSYFHYVPAQQQYVLDNVEANAAMTEYMSNTYGTNLQSIYAIFANEAKKKMPHAKDMVAGMSYSKIGATEAWGTGSMPKDPRYYHKLNLTSKQQEEEEEEEEEEGEEEEGEEEEGEEDFQGYSDFSHREHLNLQSPKFEVKPPVAPPGPAPAPKAPEAEKKEARLRRLTLFKAASNSFRLFR